MSTAIHTNAGCEKNIISSLKRVNAINNTQDSRTVGSINDTEDSRTVSAINDIHDCSGMSSATGCPVYNYATDTRKYSFFLLNLKHYNCSLTMACAIRGPNM